MADNVTLDAGVGGATAATDDIGGIHYQRVKVTWGTDGTANDANASTPLPVTVTSSTALTPGTAAANLGKAEDAAHASGDTGVLLLGVRRDTPASGAGTDGDYATLNFSSSGYAYTLDQNSAAALTSLQAIETAVEGTLAVGTHAVTQSGTWNVTVNAAIAAGNNNIGDVDIASIAAGDNNIGNVDVVTLPALAAGTNAIGKLAANTGVDIGDVDVTSIVPGTAATNLGKAEDAAHTSGDVGVMGLAVRRDADTTLAGTDGDYAPLQVNAAGSLKVAITAGAGSGGTSIADGASFTRDTTSLTPVGGVVEASAPTVTAGDAVALSITTGGAVRVAVASGGIAGVVEDAAAAGGEEGVMVLAVRRDSASSGVGADGDFAALSVDSNGALRVTGGGGGTQFAEDAAHVSADVGTLALAVRRDTAAAGSGTDGDYSTLNVNSAGRLYTSTTIDAALPGGTNNIGDVDVLTLPNVTLAAGTNTNEVVGDAAHDAAIAGNPVRVAGRGMSADYTAVATGDTADLLATLLGKLVSVPYALPGNTWNYAAASGGIVNTTGVSAKAAAGAGIRNYVTRAQIVNGHATVDTDVQIRDGASGTVLWRGFAKAAGGGVTCVFDPPLRGTANTLIEVANGTTGSAVYFNLQGFVAAE